MKNKIKDFIKVSVKERSDLKILREEIRNIIEEFKRNNIEFCILRNYNQLEKQKDLDILVKDRKGIKKIMKGFGFRRRSSYGPYTSYKRKDLWLDFKVGCLAYNGFFFEDASSILNRKRRYKYYYILKEEDEFIHLILHTILFKRYFKDKYKIKINQLIKNVDRKEVIKKLESRFFRYGKKIFILTQNQQYEELLKLRSILFWDLFNIKDFTFFCIMKSVGYYGALYVKLFK